MSARRSVSDGTPEMDSESEKTRKCHQPDAVFSMKPLLQTAGVWSGGLADSSSVCGRRIIMFKNSWKCPDVCGLQSFLKSVEI